MTYAVWPWHNKARRLSDPRRPLDRHRFPPDEDGSELGLCIQKTQDLFGDTQGNSASTVFSPGTALADFLLAIGIPTRTSPFRTMDSGTNKSPAAYFQDNWHVSISPDPKSWTSLGISIPPTPTKPTTSLAPTSTTTYIIQQYHSLFYWQQRKCHFTGRALAGRQPEPDLAGAQFYLNGRRNPGSGGIPTTLVKSDFGHLWSPVSALHMISGGDHNIRDSWRLWQPYVWNTHSRQRHVQRRSEPAL